MVKYCDTCGLQIHNCICDPTSPEPSEHEHYFDEMDNRQELEYEFEQSLISEDERMIKSTEEVF